MKKLLALGALAALLASCTTVPSSHTTLESLTIDPKTGVITVNNWQSGKDVAIIVANGLDGKGNIVERSWTMRSETNAGAFQAFESGQTTLRDSIELSKEALKRVPVQQ